MSLRHDDIRRTCRRLALFSCAVATAALFVRVPLAAVAGEESSANESSVAGDGEPDPLQIPQIIVDAGSVADSEVDADLDAVVAIWKKLRGDAPGEPDVSALRDLLRIAKGSDIGSPDGTGRIRTADSARRRYGEERRSPRRFGDGAPLYVAPGPIGPTPASAGSPRATGEPSSNATREDRLGALRETTRRLDAMAEELDDLEFYEQADGLREQAQAIRMQWRQLRGTNTPAAPVYRTPPVYPNPIP